MSANLLAIIPARGGSKRIPHKNIKEFDGKPLISYSIQTALDSGLFSDVIVSTDDPEIAQVAQEYGAQVPFMRDAELSNDFAGTNAVTEDAYKRMKQMGKQYNGVCTIYATAPLLTPYHLKKAYEKFVNEKADSLYSCCEFPFPFQRGVMLDEDGAPYPIMPECMPMRSQDLPKAYQDAGQFYFASIPYIEYYAKSEVEQNQHCTPVFIKRVYEMPRYRVIDIDTMEDWEYAQILAKAIKGSNYI